MSVPENLEENEETVDNTLGHESSELLLVATHKNKVVGINSNTHVVEDLWEIGSEYTITHLEAVCADDGVCYVVCACRGGKIFIRIDWEESPKFYDCRS